MAHLLILRGAMGAGKSAVASELEKRHRCVKIIEVDDIKKSNHPDDPLGCNADDFRDAGTGAKMALDAGWDVVVVEAFCTRDHLDFILTATGRYEDSPDASIVWLHCSLETAVQRKGAMYGQEIINYQHQRYAQRYCCKSEVVICTDSLSVTEVAEELLRCLTAEAG